MRVEASLEVTEETMPFLTVTGAVLPIAKLNFKRKGEALRFAPQREEVYQKTCINDVTPSKRSLGLCGPSLVVITKAIKK